MQKSIFYSLSAQDCINYTAFSELFVQCVVQHSCLLQSREGSIEVAIKVFVQSDSVQPSSAIELARNYADMRYELNKLSTMKHPFIVRFVGVLTNPLCFVLEWAQGKSLEHIRQTQVEMSRGICPTALFLVLLQVSCPLSHFCTCVLLFMGPGCFPASVTWVLLPELYTLVP